MEIDVSDGNFEEKVIEKSSELPVVVDFWAPWCGPCQMLGPILEGIAGSEKYKGKFVLAKLNIEENQEIAGKYGIMSIPSVKMFRDGEVVLEFAGVKPREAVEKWLDEGI